MCGCALGQPNVYCAALGACCVAFAQIAVAHKVKGEPCQSYHYGAAIDQRVFGHYKKGEREAEGNFWKWQGCAIKAGQGACH